MRLHRRRGADEGDADRLRRAHERHRRTAEAEVVGDQPDRCRGIGQEAVGRMRAAVRRVVDKEVARRVAQVGMLAGIADERRVPGLEHVGATRALGDAARLDAAHQLVPLGRHLAAVGQRRRIAEVPRSLDTRRPRDLVEMQRDVLAATGVQPARDPLGHGRTDHDRRQHQQAVLEEVAQGYPPGVKVAPVVSWFRARCATFVRPARWSVQVRHSSPQEHAQGIRSSISSVWS